MTEERFFITGAMGCVGAWIIRNLIQAGVQTIVFDLSTNRQRLELIMTPEEIEQIHFITGDITKTETVVGAVKETNTTHIIHLAALQVPFCKADPVAGAMVNVVGTVNVFEAAKQAGLKQITYASSVAVYGRKADYSERLLSHNSLLKPFNLYGVYKQANEGTARIYWQDDQIASIGLRPYTVYGPGRDQGLTSTPTKAMFAASLGESYHISYGGYNGFQFADDVAKIFIQAARTPLEGAEIYNIQGEIAHMGDIVAAIETVEPGAKGKITFEDSALPFPDGQEDTELRALLGDVPATPLVEGVAKTITHFKTTWQDGRVTRDRYLS